MKRGTRVGTLSDVYTTKISRLILSSHWYNESLTLSNETASDHSISFGFSEAWSWSQEGWSLEEEALLQFYVSFEATVGCGRDMSGRIDSMR